MKILSEGSAFQNECIFDFTLISVTNTKTCHSLENLCNSGAEGKKGRLSVQGESFLCSISIAQTFAFVPTTKLGPACIALKEEDTRLVAG